MIKRKGGLSICISKKRLFFWMFSLFLLAGCTDNTSQSTGAKKEPNQQKISSNETTMKLSDFNKVNTLSVENDSKYEFQNLTLGNAEAIILQPVRLKKGETVTLTFKIQSNDSISHVNVGVIKDFSSESMKNYDIKSIYSKSIQNELTVNYTSKEDSTYGICILGTMAGTIELNGTLTKN